MLTKDKYDNGLRMHEQLKYNIQYNRKNLFNVVRSNLASKLLNSIFASELTEEQKESLNKLI